LKLFSRRSTGEQLGLEKPILAECAVVHALTTKIGQLQLFKRLSYQHMKYDNKYKYEINIEYEIFRIFHTPSKYEAGIEGGGIFLSGLVCLITRQMEHIMHPTVRFSVQNSGRDSRTLHTHRQTHRTDRSKRRLIHE
jgi:hypothetical protein